jgi:enoyl-CoA hydratase
VRNAIDQTMVDELHGACEILERRPRVALLVGSGGAFASGADIGQLRERGWSDALRGINSRVFERIAKLPMPTIGLLEGHVLGGGAELAYACDFRIGTPTTIFGQPEPGLGVMAAAGGAWRLSELVGETIAKEMLLAGRRLDAVHSLAAGLLSEIVEPDELLPAGHRLADRIVDQSAQAVQLTKAVFRAPRAAHPAMDDLAQALLFESDEKQRRMTAFLERRSAKDK